MNEEQINELKKLVDGLRSQGLSTQDIQSQVDIKKQEFLNPDFQTPTTLDAVVEETAASDTESNSENTSLELPEDPNRDKLIQLETELEATRSDPKTMNSDENFRKRKSLNKQIKELGGFKKIKEEKLEEVVIEPKEEVDVKRRADLRKSAQEILNGNNIYEFGIEGNDIFELANGQNKSKFEVALKDKIKEKYSLGTTFKGEFFPSNKLPQTLDVNRTSNTGSTHFKDDLVTIDRIVRDEIEKLKNKKSFEARQVGISKVNEMKRSGEYAPALDFAVGEFMNDLDSDEQKKFGGFQMQINQLNKTISQSTDATEIKSSEEKRNALLESQKLVASQFEENPYDIFNISNKEQNTPYIDESGNSVGSFEAQESSKGLLTQPKKEYTAILDSYKNLNLENLENETVFWGLEKQDLDIDLNKTVNLKVGKKFMQESSVPGDALKSLGYNIESFDWKDDNANVGIIKDVKYSDLIKFRNSTTMFGLGFWDNISVDSKDADIGKIKLELEELYKDKVNLNLRQRALTSLFVLNTDPASKKISAVDFVATATKNTFTSIAGIVDKSVTPEMAAFLPVTKREDLDNLQIFLERADIKLSSEQKENFKRGFGFELLGETIPNFSGDLGRFAALNKVAGATGLTAAVATMMKTNPIRGFMAQSLLEGFKFAAVMEDTSMFSEGVYFGAGSQIAGKLLPKLPGPLAKYQQLYEKFLGGGAGMASGSEFAAFSHAVVDHAMGDKAFQTSMDDLYGENSGYVKRIMSNLSMGGLLGGIKTKKIDIMEMSKRRDLYFETFSDIANGKYKGSELKKKQVMLSHLKRGMDIVDKHFNEADLGKQKEAKDTAQKFIDKGEGSRAEIKEAKKIINTYELNKQRAKNKIKKQEERLIRSGVFKDGFRVDIVDGNQRILGKGNKAEYDGLNNVITVDINQYRPGVFAQEVGHAMMKAAFKNRPEVAKMFKEKIEELTNEKLKGEKFEVDGKTDLTFEEAIKEAYKKPKRAEEYVMNVVEFLSQPKYRELLLEKGMLNELKRNTILFGNKSKLDFTNSKNFTDGQQLLEFLYSINKVAEGGSSAQIKNKFKAFKNIVIDNKKLYNKSSGKEITKEDISNSKLIRQEKKIPAEYDIERIKTNLELNKDVGNAFLRQRNKQELEIQLKRAEEVESLINKSPEELRTSLELAKDVGNFIVRERNIKDLKYALAAQQRRAKEEGKNGKKKARVFDFDDTLAKSKSNVLYTMPNGKKGKLNATEFAKRSEALEAAGAKFDFTEFSKVIDGKKGPLFELAKFINESPGRRDMFVLTARPQNSAPAIHKFLKELGLNIPLENITGLANGTPKAKSDWIKKKAKDGYNDFYFADDAIKNVKAVRDVLKTIDVKSKVQTAKEQNVDASKEIENSKDLQKSINNLLPKEINTKDKYDAFLRDPSTDAKGFREFFENKGYLLSERAPGKNFSIIELSEFSKKYRTERKNLLEATLDNGMISNYAKSRAIGSEAQQVVDNIRTRRLFNYDPSKAIGPDGFVKAMFSGVKFETLQARKDIANKIKTEDVTESKAANRIADNIVKINIKSDKGGGTPSAIQSNLKVNNKRVFERKEIVEEIDGKKVKRIQRNEIANKFIKEADAVLQQVADLGFKPTDKGFRKALAKVITKNNPELVDAFKESLGNYENFINENYATLLINKKALPLEFFVQAEKFRANVNENIFVKKSTNPKYKDGRATKQDLIREAIRKGKASYTENEAQGVNVYDRLTPPKAVGVNFFKIPNVKKRLIESLYKASIVDAVINQSRSKKIYTTAEVKEISTKLQKESDLYFSKAITTADKAKQIKQSIISRGYGEKGRYKSAKEQVKDYEGLIDYAESIGDPLILNLLERANVTPTSYDFKRYKNFYIGNGVKNTELRKELYDAGIIVDIATIHDYAASKFGVEKLTDKQTKIVTFGKSVQNINKNKNGTAEQQAKALVGKNNKNETLRKDAILEYSKSVLKLMKFNPRATFSLIYNQSARGGQNRQLSKVMGWENGIKVGIKGERDVHLEHLLQNGEFNLVLIDAAKSNSKSGVEQVLKWISKNYKQYAVKTTTANLVDKPVLLKDGTKWKAKSELHPDIKTAIKKVLNGEKEIKIPDADLRLFNEAIKVNPNLINLANGTLATKWNVEVPKRFHNVQNVWNKQGELIFKQIKGKITAAQAKKEIDLFINKIAPSNIKAALKISKGKTKDIKEAIEKVQEVDKINVEKQKEVYASKNLNSQFNKFLESSTGIGAEKVFSESKGTVRGKKVKKSFGDYVIPVGAEDFAGLLHKTLAKGKQGEKQLEFYKKNLYDPYNLANENITRERTALMNDFKALKQNLTSVPKNLNKMTKGGDFTVEQALRVAVWEKQGMEIPGLSKTDKIELLKEVNSNPELSNFVTELLKTTKGDGYAKPENNWELGTIATDLMSLLNGAKRTKHLEVWKGNVEEIFSKENRYKLEAAYGRDWMQTMGKTLERMKNGSNRKWGGNPTVEKWLDWVNGSVGAIMFLNTRSAALQTISSVNYLNFSDNNPLAAAKAFANQPQFWKDFKEIYNSDYLKDRRGGNKINVNESELALASEKGGFQGVVSLLLNKGFVLTKGADSFAIASGGSAMYRNRLNKYKKEGLSEKEAKEKAFLDFKAITEETQQSSRPDRISEQQASNAGRLLLAFANTPMQYNRLIKRNAQDLFEGRGNKAEKISRIAYYSTVQNFIFNALQKALFAVGFGDDDEESVKKYSSIGNGMVDSLLRGSGLTGNAVLAVKNVAIDVADRFDRPRPNFQDAAWKALTVSPPIYSKVSKLRGAGFNLGLTTADNIFKPSLDNPALAAGAQLSSAALNLPLDRVLRKAQNIEAAMSDEAEWWQRSALLMGWGEWELGMDESKKQAKKRKGSKTNIVKF